MSALVTEMWSAREFARGSFARRGFQITGVTTEAEAEAALASQKTVAVATGFPLDTTLRVPPGGITIKFASPTLYVAAVSYEATTIGEQPPELLAEKWRVTIEPLATDEATEYDRNGRPVVNTFGDPFDQPSTRPVPEVRIVMWRWESTYELAKHLAYANKYNSAPIALPKLGTAAAEEVLCEAVRLKDEVAADAEVVAVQYTFRARPKLTASSGTYHGFHSRRMDLGARGANATATSAPITYKSGPDKGKPVSTPVRLDGSGRPFDSTAYEVGGAAAAASVLANPAPKDVTADAVFLLFDFTNGPIDFAGLNIGANL